jgi:hypothetical protein
LERADEVRLARAALRHDLKNGEITLADALERPEAQTMMVWQLVKCQWRWGDQRTLRLSSLLVQRYRVTIDYGKRVQGLTDRQKLALIKGAERCSPESARTRTCTECGVELERPALLCGFCAAEESGAA